MSHAVCSAKFLLCNSLNRINSQPFSQQQAEQQQLSVPSSSLHHCRACSLLRSLLYRIPAIEGAVGSSLCCCCRCHCLCCCPCPPACALLPVHPCWQDASALGWAPGICLGKPARAGEGLCLCCADRNSISSLSLPEGDVIAIGDYNQFSPNVWLVDGKCHRG